MEKPKFNNRPNWEFHGVGASYWVSRSVAVEMFLWAYTMAVENPELHILTIQRSENMPDEPNKICCPCGYLDWDENGFEGLIREVYEETSLYLNDIQTYMVSTNNRQPFYTETNPNSNKKQNIVLLYTGFYNFGEDPLPDIESYTCPETKRVRWMKFSEFEKEKNRNDWAFNHNKRIEQSYNFLLNRGIL